MSGWAPNAKGGLGAGSGPAVVGIDPGYGASGRTGVDANGALDELRGPVAAPEMFRVLRAAWEGHERPGSRVLAVEWPFIPEPQPGPAWRARAEGALQLAGAASAWATIGALLGARVLTPSAVQWRPWLVAELRAAGLRAPAVGSSRERWKRAALDLMGGRSDHVAEARCLRRWAMRHVAEGLTARGSGITRVQNQDMGNYATQCRGVCADDRQHGA